jgi:hypothetical protein
MSYTMRYILCWAYAIGVVAALAFMPVPKRNVVYITQRDIVRYCMDRRRVNAPEKEIQFYCTELHGDEYITMGITPNYSQFHSDKYVW